MNDNQIKLGKITVYGKEIDLDNTPVEELEKMGKALERRLVDLGERYVELCEQLEELEELEEE